MSSEPRPIQLISIDSEGKCLLTKEAEEFINSIKSNLAIICVSGLYRTGKSYLLNRILNRQSGFEIGGTIKSCTKGIWIWSETIKIDNFECIVIDSEGLGSAFNDRNQSIDMIIFTLSVLLSSYFIYNSLKIIDEAALESLSLVINFSKKLKGDLGQMDSFLSTFPSLLWVIRDFALDLKDDDGNNISSNEYLERALNINYKDEKKKSNEKKTILNSFDLEINNASTENNDKNDLNLSDDQVNVKNETRRLIKYFFRERDCFTLVKPIFDDKKLRYIDKIDEDELRQEFLIQMKNLTNYIKSSIKPKTIQGVNVNGQMFVNLTKAYIKAINNNSIPDVKTSLKSILEIQVNQIKDKASKVFIDGILNLDYNSIDNYEELITSFEDYKKGAFSFSSQLCTLNVPNEMLVNFMLEMNENFLRNIKDIMKKWYELSSNKCENIYLQIIKDFNDNKEDEVDFLLLLEVFNEIQTHLDESVTNECKYQVILPKIFSFFINVLKKDYIEEKSRWEFEINSLKAENSSMKSVLTQTKLLLESNKAEFEKNLQLAKEETQSIRLSLEERLDEANKLIRSLKVNNENTIEDLKGNIESLQEQIQKKNRDLIFEGKINKIKGSSSDYSDTIIEGIMLKLDSFKENLLKVELDKARMNLKHEINYRVSDVQEEFQKKISSLRKETEKIILQLKSDARKDIEEYRQIIKVRFIIIRINMTK